MGKLLTIIIGCSCLLLPAPQAQHKGPASAAELKEITDRGRMLFEYDTAAWYSTDAVQELAPPAGSVTGYVGKKTNKGWMVAYGRFNTTHDKFLIPYEAVQGASPKEFHVIKHEPPVEDSAFFYLAARAQETALAAFKTEVDRPYNVAALPAPGDQFWVYLMPAQTDLKVWPLGGDTRYLISKDGARIIETRQLHKAIIEFRADENAKGGYHTAVLDEVPEDTDVFHVLTRQPAVPELIATRTYIYVIDPDGSARYLMPAEEYFKQAKPGGNSPPKPR